MVYIATTGGRGETIYCASVRAMTGGGGGPKQKGCLQRIVLIRAHKLRTKRISWKGQGIFPHPIIERNTTQGEIPG